MKLKKSMEIDIDDDLFYVYYKYKWFFKCHFCFISFFQIKVCNKMPYAKGSYIKKFLKHYIYYMWQKKTFK